MGGAGGREVVVGGWRGGKGKVGGRWEMGKIMIGMYFVDLGFRGGGGRGEG